MAIYLDQRVDQIDATSALRNHEILQWHTKQDIMAVASFSQANGAEINFFADTVILSFHSFIYFF